MSHPDTVTVTTTAPRGKWEGNTFCDTLLIGDITTSVIRRITIYYEDEIYALKVKYSWNEFQNEIETLHGASNGFTTVIDLVEDEFVTGIEGYSSESYITRLTVITNKRKYDPCGEIEGEYFQWGDIRPCQGTEVPHMRLLAFSGRVDKYLSMLQGIFIAPNGHNTPASTANYEVTTSASVSGETGAVGPLSIFTSHLQAPVITLYVGRDRVEFHVHEDTVCALPFFRAGLHGSFQESLSMTINMPEDEPRMVSALIEYLYTGTYTYLYDSTTSPLRVSTGTPVSTLVEGQYHVEVFRIASKYDTKALADTAVQNFNAVLPDLDPINTLRLWKYAYGEGPDSRAWRNDFGLCYSENRLVSWVGGLFKDHRDEVDQTIAEFPELASDLIRLAICGNV